MEETFLTLDSKPGLSAEDAILPIKKSKDSGFTRWMLIRPQKEGHHKKGMTRGADLVKKLTLAKSSGAEGIFHPDVFHKDYGLLNPDGAPGELFFCPGVPSLWVYRIRPIWAVYGCPTTATIMYLYVKAKP